MVVVLFVDSHPPWHVGENCHYRQRREKLQCNWLEGDTWTTGYSKSYVRLVLSRFPSFFCFFLILGWLGHRLWEHHHAFKSPTPDVRVRLRHCCSGDRTRWNHAVQEEERLFLICPRHLFQEAVAQGFEREYELFGSPESYFQQLPAILVKKRDRLACSLRTAGFKPVIPEGGYYLMADISCVSECHSLFESPWFLAKEGNKWGLCPSCTYSFFIFWKCYYH